MKSLKIDHYTAQRVIQSVDVPLWLGYDNKHVGVGDILQIIDKVDPQDPKSWQPLGTRGVRSVVEKRLVDLTPDEMNEAFGMRSQQDVVAFLQKHLGPQASDQTAITLAYLEEPREQDVSNDEEHQPVIKSGGGIELKVFADGGSRGNPGPSASGYVVMSMADEVLERGGVYLGVTTNNQAEYRALKLALEAAMRHQARMVHVYMDSMLVVNQMKGVFKVKNRDLWPIHDAVKELLTQFKQVNFTHVPRELNKDADRAVNEALDDALKHNHPQTE